MKLHLPHTLRTALLCAFSLLTTLGTSNTYAAGLHSQVSLVTYTDFGQNMGRYRVNGVNDLLSSIRQRDGGVVITYTEGHDDYTLDHYMISYESQGDNGAYAAVGYNMIATVAHNGCQNPTFTGRYIDGANSLNYRGVEYRDSIIFCMQPGGGINVSYAYDFKMTRLNKLITDVTTSELAPRFAEDYDYSQLHGIMEYRAGSGTMTLRHLDRSIEGLIGAYAYVTGGVQHITTGGTTDRQWGCFTAGGNLDPSANGINENSPLPFVGQAGDSGSPVWIWDDASQSYLYLAAYQSGSDWFGQARGSINFAWDCLTKFDKLIDMEQGASRTVHIKGVVARDDDQTVSDSSRSTRLHLGTVEDGRGKALTTYVGVKADNNDYIHTWLNLAPMKDNEKWYTYNEAYYNVGGQRAMEIEDLYNDSNLVFRASSETGNVVEVDEDTDLGIGYLQFAINPESGLEHAEYTLQSNGKTGDGRGGQRDFMANSAGFVVEKGVDLHVKLTNTQWDSAANDYYYREWRKVGAGDLYMEGLGSNQIFLNVGGSGTTYLNERDGYAAYNVYVGSGSTVVMDSTDQIARDFTFGYNGGVLDIRGNNEMDWYRTNPNVGAQGFSINSLSEDGLITNSQAGTTLNLTYREGGETEYLGSFVDTEDGGSVRITFDAGYDANTILRGIHTDLQNGGSGITVKSGAVTLAGSNTVHALGSANGRNTNRYFSAEDWHYADMAADVLVEGGTFILGSHARLKGNITLTENGSLIIHEGVLNTYEYIEGGLRLEDTTTDFYRQFYGLKGDINTAAGSMILIAFDEATTAEQVYGGSITGGGDMLVSLGGGGATLRLTGESGIGGYKELMGGGLVSDNGVAALGSAADNDHAWYLYDDAYIAAKGATGEELLGMVMRESEGVLALTQAQETDLKLGEKGYNELIVGALAGMDVHYGTEGAALSTVLNGGKKQWLLGGGGGNLIVDFALQNADAELVLGNEYTTGSVTLTNEQNTIGSITFKGQVTLDYTSEEALGGADISLNYTNRLKLLSEGGLARVTKDSSGVALVDKLPDTVFDLRDYQDLYLGAAQDTVLHAAPTVAAGTAYRFGGIEGVLTLDAALRDAGGLATGLIVDGQTFSGGVLELVQAAGVTGDVEVRGYNEEKMLQTMPRRGDITLRLSVGNAIASARSVTLDDGGIIDINGTAQTFHNLTMAQGSLLTDGSAARGGSVLVDVESGRTTRLAGTLDVATLTKVGQGNLELSGANYCGAFTIESGTVTLGSSNALSTVGATVISRNGTLNAANVALNHSIRLDGGTLVAGGNNVGGSLAVAAGGSGIVTQQGGSTTINASIDVGQGGTLELRGNEYTLTSEAVNTAADAGSISVLANKLNINNSEVADVGGTLSFDSASNQTLCSNRSADNTTRNIAHLHIGGGANKELHLDEVTWNTIWNIGKLTGEGKLVWDSDTTHWFSTRVILGGDNTFSGSIVANRKNTGSPVRPYASHLELAGDGAAKEAHLVLSGADNNDYMGLAINTENASMLSLKGNAYTVLYAAPAMAGIGKQKGEGNTTPGGLDVKPVSTRNATLSITGDANTTFSGDVQGGDNGLGLSIVKTGSGTQTFDGATVVFNDVSALGGTLNLNSNGLTVKGNLTIARGAALSMSGTYSLGSGKQLTVGGLATDGSAQLSTALSLGGGTICFSAEALNNSNAALSLSSLSGNSVNIDFTDTSALEAGTYHLANGNWTGVSVTGVALPYMDVTFQKGSNSLKATLALKSGCYVWAGTPSSHTWSGNNFGPRSVSFGATDTAVFTDAATGKEVAIGSSRTIGSLIFDSSERYTVDSSGSYTVTATTLEQLGRGTTVVNGGISAASIKVQAGELLVRDASLLEGATSITGGGTLGIEVAGTVALNGKLSGDAPLEMLHILSGTYASDSQLNAGRVLVDGGAAFQLQANQSAKVETAAGATVALGGSTLSGSLTLAGDTLVTSSGGTLAADVRTGGHLLTTSGNMTINKPALEGRLRVDSGTLTLTGGNYGNLSDITIGSGGAIRLTYGNNITNGVHVAMEDGSVLASEAGSGTSRLDIDVLGGTAEIQGCWQGNTLNVAGTISGNGTLKLGHNYGNRWTVSSTIADGTDAGDCLAVAVDSYVTISGRNTYSGGTTLIDRELTVGNANALGTGGLTVNGGTLVINNGLNVASVGGTGGAIRFNSGSLLTITGNADASYSGSLANTANILKQGTGRQEFTRAAAYGAVAVQGGTLALNAAELGSQVSVAAGAELQLTGGHTVLHAPILNAGALTFTASAPVLELASDGGFTLEGGAYIDIDGNESADGNGFARGGRILVVGMGEGATLAPNSATVSYQGGTLQLDSNGVAWLGEKSTRSYSVRLGKVTYDEAFAQKAATRELESFILATALEETPAELEVSEDLPQDVVILTTGRGGILSLGENVSLSVSRLDIGASTILNGSGRLELAAEHATLPQAVEFGPEWTGTAAVSNVAFSGGFSCASLGTADSWVELKGTSGYLTNQTISNNLILARGANGWAFEQNNGNNGTVLVFSGKVKGDGNLGRSNGTGSTYTYEFSGDISGWTGNFISSNNADHYTMFRVKGDATEVNANLLFREPTVSRNDFRVEVQNTARFNGRIEANRLIVSAGANATLAGTSSFNTSLSVADGATLANLGHATMAGDVDIAGSFSNSGTLNVGNITSWSGALQNTEQGNVVLDSALAVGTIVNRGTITVSDLMIGPDATYTDANGSSTTGNGFATSSFEVFAVGVIQNQGGAIMYGGQDVTQQVLSTGRLDRATNLVSYRINSTDNTVSFSQIAAASQGALEHIVFANGTALKVDNAAGGAHLRSSLLEGTGTPTLQLQDGAQMVLDSSLSATAEVGSGSTASVRAADAETGSSFSISKTGAGMLRFTGEAGARAAAGSLNLNAGSAEVADGAAPFTTITLGNNTSLSFTAESGPAEFAAERIQDSSSDNYGRNITVGEGAELNLGYLSNAWGLGTLRVDGVLNVADSLDFATGGNNSQNNNVITGSGIINAQNLKFANVGTYNITSMTELNVLGSMSHTSNTKINVSGSTINFYGLVNETNGSLVFGSEQSSVNVYSLAGVNRFATLDMGNAKQSLAELRLGAQTVSAAGVLWMNSKQGNRILLEEHASITVGGTVIIKGASMQGEGELRLVQSGAAVQGGQYGIGNSSFRISRAEVSVDTASGAKTISNQMSDVRLVNGGGNTLTENNASNTSFAGVEAANGDINFLNKASGLAVQDIMIGAGHSVGVYQAGNAVEAGEATLTISGTLAAKGANGRLNANVVMETGSTLDASATGGSGIALGSSLTIRENINLSDADFEAVAGLGYGDRYTLFNGVDSLTLDKTYTEAITPEMQINAADWFHGVEPEKYYVVYDGSNVGQVAIFCATPEPATSTLSLLALAALCMRKRRK